MQSLMAFATYLMVASCITMVGALFYRDVIDPDCSPFVLQSFYVFAGTIHTFLFVGCLSWIGYINS